MTRGEATIPDKPATQVFCVVSPSKNAYSETFIRAHIEGLRAELIEGDWPFCEGDHRDLVGARARFGMDIGRKLAQRQSLGAMGAGLEALLRRGGESRIRQWLQTKGVQAVLAEYGTTGAWLLPVCHAARIGLVVHFHGADAYQSSILAEYGQRYREIFRSDALIVVVSKDMKRQIVELGATEQRVFINPYGVNLEQFSFSEAGKNGQNLLAVGRMVNKKAPHLVMLAFARIAQRNRLAQLDFVGDGPLFDSCTQMAAALTGSGVFAPGQVNFLGRQKPEQVAALLRAARAFVQHSVRAVDGDVEGTPVAVLEAGATGIPVIATRHMGIQEAVIDGETGLLSEERDICAMSENMERLLTDPVEAGRLGRKGREHIAANYAMNRQIGGLRDILRQASGH